MKMLKVCYSRITPESASIGDFSESGILEEIPFDYANDAYDYIVTNGGYRYSGSEFYDHGWYETGYYVIDLGTGEEEETTFHLNGDWTETELRFIHEKMMKRWHKTRFGV